MMKDINAMSYQPGWVEFLGALLGSTWIGSLVTRHYQDKRHKRDTDLLRESNVWREVERLHAKMDSLNQQIGAADAKIQANEAEIRALREEKHRTNERLQAMVMENDMLKREVNDLYEVAGKAPKYPNLHETEKPVRPFDGLSGAVT